MCHSVFSLWTFIFYFQLCTRAIRICSFYVLLKCFHFSLFWNSFTIVCCCFYSCNSALAVATNCFFILWHPYCILPLLDWKVLLFTKPSQTSNPLNLILADLWIQCTYVIFKLIGIFLLASIKKSDAVHEDDLSDWTILATKCEGKNEQHSGDLGSGPL